MRYDTYGLLNDCDACIQQAFNDLQKCGLDTHAMSVVLDVIGDIECSSVLSHTEQLRYVAYYFLAADMWKKEQERNGKKEKSS